MNMHVLTVSFFIRLSDLQRIDLNAACVFIHMAKPNVRLCYVTLSYEFLCDLYYL